MMSKKYDRTTENLERAGYELVRVSDLVDPNSDEGKRIRAAAESAFRRGFSQGFYACMECVEKRKPLAFIERAYLRIRKWRSRPHKGSHEVPYWPAMSE